MKRITRNFSFDFLTNLSINGEKLERNLVLGLNDAFSAILYILGIEIWDSEPTQFDHLNIEDIEEDHPPPYASQENQFMDRAVK